MQQYGRKEQYIAENRQALANQKRYYQYFAEIVTTKRPKGELAYQPKIQDGIGKQN